LCDWTEHLVHHPLIVILRERPLRTKDLCSWESLAHRFEKYRGPSFAKTLSQDDKIFFAPRRGPRL
jgi:hypothetical protein